MDFYKNMQLADLDGEIWKPIGGFEYYQVSSYGRVKSLPKKLKRGSLGGFTISRERIKSQRVSKGGYLITDLYYHSRIGKTCYVHILVASAFVENLENKPEVNHKTGVKTDNRASELEWNTCKENTQHGIAFGLIDSNGEKCGTSKLKDSQVLEIRNLYKRNRIPYSKKNGLSLKTIGDKYGVCAVTIKHVLDKTKWKHI